MTNDDLEFSISQYLDNTLEPSQRAALEVRLSSDAEARATLDAYRRLDMALKSLPLPAVRWDALAASISSAIDATSDEQASRSYRMPAWLRMAAMPLALAASLLIVAGVSVEIYLGHQAAPAGWANSGTHVTGNPTVAVSSVFVDLPTDKVNGPVVEQVAIGPAVMGDGEVIVQYNDDVISRPSRVAIASGVVPAHDTVSLSSFDMQ